MSNFGEIYAQYYNLLYQDKDYQAEVEYIHTLIKQHANATSLLDLGCGTGKHAQLFSKKGLAVHGIDQSKDMLAIANKNKGKQDIQFSQADITNFALGRKFDVVTALFHVLSYQTTNQAVSNTFAMVQKHLNKGGLFIFDFWYGPAVLTDLPTVRVKRLQNDSIKVTRIAEPQLNAKQNTVAVHYDIFLEVQQTTHISQQQETHNMRYFFDTELTLFCEQAEMTILNKYAWLTMDKPNFNSWNVVWVVQL